MQRGRFSSSSEFIVYASIGVPTPGEKSPQNVLVVRGVDGDDKEHIAEKPIELVSQLLGVSPARSVVLDPFTGSGTTAIACIRTGRKFIGIEIEEKYCEIAAKRIERELAQPMLPCIEKPEPVPQKELFQPVPA